MVSFLSKIKRRTEVADISEEKAQEEPKAIAEDFEEHLQLDLDIYQTPTKIVIYAPIAGVKIDELDIFIENENDVITISGKKDIPDTITADEEENREYLAKENKWGEFYRQVILPQEVNVSKIETKVDNGILVLKLPLLRIQSKGKKRIEVRDNCDIE